MATQDYAYRLVSEAELQTIEAVGFFSGSSLDTRDGFIHLSLGSEVIETANRYFKGQTDLVCLTIGS